LIDRDSDEGDLDRVNYPGYGCLDINSNVDPRSLKKQFLIIVNEKLREKVEELKEFLDKASRFTEQLKDELTSLKCRVGDTNQPDLA
jgi:hypothetical protein